MGLVAVCEILRMICEIASVNDNMFQNDDATSIASYHRYSPIGFRHYNTNIYRAVPFLTLWLLSRHSLFRVLPFWSSLFLLARVAVLDVRIMTSSVMAQ